jgi:hypothetical protein
VLVGLGSLTTDLSDAIARMEGYTSGSCSMCVSNNNPGALRAGQGQIGTDANGFAIFPDWATGYAALNHQVDLNISRGLTLQEFFAGKQGVYAGYAPSADNNNPTNYASTVAGWLGISPDAVLSSIGDTADSSGDGSGGTSLVWAMAAAAGFVAVALFVSD